MGKGLHMAFTLHASGPCPFCLLELFSMLSVILKPPGLCPISISGNSLLHHLISHDPPFQLDWNTETHPSNPGLGTKICDREGTWLRGLYLSLEDLLGPLPDPECPREAQSLLGPLHLGGKTPLRVPTAVWSSFSIYTVSSAPRDRRFWLTLLMFSGFRIQQMSEGKPAGSLRPPEFFTLAPHGLQSLCWLPCHQGKGAVGNQLISPVLSHLEFCSPCCFRYSSVLWPFCFKISLSG